MSEFKQGDVVCLKSDLEHKFTVYQIVPAGSRKGWVGVVYWDEASNSFKYPSFPPNVLQFAHLEKDNEQQS